MNISPFSSEGGDKKTKDYFILMDLLTFFVGRR